MANEPYTGRDALGLYLTAPNGNAAGAAGALGGYRTGIEVSPLDAMIVDGGMPPLIIEKVGSHNGTEGTAYIASDGADLISYKSPGGNFGSDATLVDGDRRNILAANSNSFIRVSRDGSADLNASPLMDATNTRMTIDQRKVYGGLLSVSIDPVNSIVTDAYRAGMLHNHSDTLVSSIKGYIATLGTQRLSGTAQLSGSGAGTITTATALGFADWPDSGGCRIENTGGTFKETVYYSSRTATSLTVPASGRGILGSSATAGANTDKIYPVPLIRIATEDPGTENDIQVIANGTTAPTGRTWSTDITSAAGLSIANLYPGDNEGIWIHRHVPSDATASLRMENAIVFEFGGFTERYSGLYRVSRVTELYNHYLGTNAFPDFTSISGSHTSLPFTVALAPPVSGVNEYQLAVRHVDTYGVSALNVYPHPFKINPAGALVGSSISEPYSVTLTDEASGYVRLRARYAMGVDSSVADYFRYYLRVDGTDPVPGSDTPVAVAMRIGQGLSGDRVLDVLLGPYAFSTIVKVVVHSYRSGDTTESINTTVLSATVATVAPPVPGDAVIGMVGTRIYGGVKTIVPDIVYLNAPTNTVYFKQLPNSTALWNADGLILRGVVGGVNGTTLFTLAAGWVFNDVAVSGTGVAGAVEVADAHTLYLCVGGQRVAKIDTTAQVISCAGHSFFGVITGDAPSTGPTVSAPTYVALQVFDDAAGVWRSFLAVDSAGNMTVATSQQRGT